MSIQEVIKRIGKIYPEFKLSIREDGDVYIFTRQPDNWKLVISFDTLPELITWLKESA